MSHSTPPRKKKVKTVQSSTPPNKTTSSSSSSVTNLHNPGDISLETIINSPFKKSASPFKYNNYSNESLSDKDNSTLNLNSKGSQLTNDLNSNNLMLSQYTQLKPPGLEDDNLASSGVPTPERNSRGRHLQNSRPETKTAGINLSPYRRLSPTRSPVRSSQLLPTESQKIELIQLSPNKLKHRMQQLNHTNKQQLSMNESKGKRLYISQLVLTNFKSYAGKQVVGPFHENFTAVVGPNGSGKSNVIDSMLFVFGFRANKLRQGKLSELIHKSETHSDLQYCSVDVHFKYRYSQNEVAEEEPPLETELIVTRKAYKNNVSKYYINGKESTYTQVTDLLRQEGIDLDHKRFLILQGEVESIAQMKPKADKEGEDGVLEYLEDIIGTAQYKEDIESFQKEIETLNDVCLEKEHRFKIVETEKDSLEEAKDEALEYVQNANELTAHKSKLYQHNIQKANSDLTNTLNKFNSVNVQLETETAKYESYQKDLSDLEENTKKYEDLLLELNTKLEALRKTQSLLTKSRISHEEKLKSLTNKKKKAENVLENVKKNSQQSTNSITDLNNEQLTMEREFETISEQLKPEKAKFDEMKVELNEKTVDISKQIQSIEKDLEPWTSKIEELQTSITLKKNELDIIEQSKLANQKRIEETTARTVSLQTRIEENNHETKKLNKELLAVNKGLEAGSREVSKANKKLGEMKEVLGVQRQKTIDARNSLTNVDNQNKVLTALNKLQNSGVISGLYGRLGDLAVIDEKYNVAVSTACPRLNDIVVETVECGQQCIDYLRKNRLGYSRFILLDKLRNFNMHPIQTPNNTPRLFDLIKASDSIFLPAFYSVLRDTLVATDLQEANRVAYSTSKRYRVVTLDGKMIDISGTMSGGGKQFFKDLMKTVKSNTSTGELHLDDASFFTQEQVAQLEKSLATKEKSFQEASNAYHEMTLAISKLENRKPEIATQLEKLKFDNDNYASEISTLSGQITDLQAAFDDHRNGIDGAIAIQEEITSLQKNVQSAKDSTKVQTDKIKVLNEQILAIGGIDFKMQKAKVDSFVERIDALNSKMRKTKTAIKKKETELKRSKVALRESEKDISKCDEDLEKIEYILSTTTADLENSNKNLEDTLNQKDEVEASFEKVKEEYELKSGENINFKSLEVELRNKLSNLEKVIGGVKHTIAKLEGKREKLTTIDISVILEALGQSMSPVVSEVGVDESQPDEQNAPEDMQVDSGLEQLSETDFQTLDVEELTRQIETLEEKISTSSTNTDVLDEYIQRLNEFNSRKADVNQAVSDRDELRDKCESLKTKRLDEFMEGFSIISLTLKEMYQLITMGGNAELELVDSLDPFSEGVLFSVMPPKKSWRNISNLSGGEKTLSSLALVFALHKYKPTPIYIMDEIDAALDFRNVSIVANYIKDKTKDAQFIVISLRNNMFELSKQLVGIYKNENMTKSSTIKNIDLVHI